MKTLSDEIREALHKSPADYVREERARIRRELLAELRRLDEVFEQLSMGAGDMWYSRKELIAALDRIIPEEE